MPIDIEFVELLTPPNFDGAMILRDSEGDHLTLSKLWHEPPGGIHGNPPGGLYLQGTYLNSSFNEDRPLKLIEVFLCLADLAVVDTQTEIFRPALTLPTPGIDQFTIDWTTQDGTSLDAKLHELYRKFRKLTGVILNP